MTADERTLLEGFLDWQRATLLVKCAGLTPQQLAREACPPSTLSLIKLVRHLADVEVWWFQHGWTDDFRDIFVTPQDPDFDFNGADAARADEDRQLYLDAVATARAEAAKHTLDDVAHKVRDDGSVRDVSLRWIYIHMIEEYARHNGHADLLREKLDGVTGE